MRHSADTRTDKLLNSQGFRAELQSWLASDGLAVSDIAQLHLTRDESGQRMIVAELHDGRERAFPFSTHWTH